MAIIENKKGAGSASEGYIDDQKYGVYNYFVF